MAQQLKTEADKFLEYAKVIKGMTKAQLDVVKILIGDKQQYTETKVNDPYYVQQFIRECLIIDPVGQISNKRLTELYNEWSNKNYSPVKFGYIITPMGIKIGLKKIRRKKGNVWLGISEK